MSRTGKNKRPYRRLSAGERARFLEVMRATGNRRAAAAAIGVEPRLMDQRRESDPELDREWEEAAEAVHRRLSAAKGPFDCPQDRPLNMIRRGKRGRLQLVAAGEKRWTADTEQKFMAALRATGNVRAAARRAGFSESAVWDRHRKWPAFAAAIERLLDEAGLSLQFRLGFMGNNVVPAEATGEDDGDGAGNAPARGPSIEGRGDEAAPIPFDPDLALRFLKWREEKKNGRGRWAPRAKPPTIEEVTEKIVRQVEAIKRQRRQEKGE